MSNVIISEEEYKKLLHSWYILNTLETADVDYAESFRQNLEWWNNEYPEEQYEHWEDLVEFSIEEETKDVNKGVYIFWEDGIIQGVYSTYDKAYKAMCAAIDKIDSVKVDWADEDCGFTTVYSKFGEIVEFEISDCYEVM